MNYNRALKDTNGHDYFDVKHNVNLKLFQYRTIECILVKSGGLYNWKILEDQKDKGI